METNKMTMLHSIPDMEKLLVANSGVHRPAVLKFLQNTYIHRSKLVLIPSYIVANSNHDIKLLAKL